MKISVNWLREFTDIKLPIDELVKKIGAQLGEVEEVVSLGERYEGVVVAKVVLCEKHPNADKLNVCKIDDGGVTKGVKRDSKGLVQVVCGAPNVRAGISVAWIPPGAIVPSTYEKDQFKLDVRPLRGVDSNGMLGSAKELQISDDHDGILIVDKPAKPGTSFAQLYELDDYIIDIENKMFTHRPDCFGILGVAREIAGIQNIKFTSPKWYLHSLPIKASKSDKKLPLTIKNEIPELVPRFMAVPLSDIKVTKSPIIMQSYLSRLGIKSINNVVDITNFIMLLTAQPTHAYDYDKVAAQDNSSEATIKVRLPKKGEKIALLNGKTIQPHDKAIMIATEKRPIGVGGVMGGTDTEVDSDTKNIILECASFDMYSVRKTSMTHGLFTDAVTRFNKGQSPLQNDVVLTYGVGMLQKLANAELAGKVTDTAAHKSQGFWKGIHASSDFINARLGLDISTAQIATLLKNVEISVSTNGKNLIASPPFWRTDLEIPEDIVEEVGRLYGYDHLPLTLPKRDITPAQKDDMLDVKSKVRDCLSRAGANEVLTYSFVHGDLFDKTGQDKKQAYQVSNALSPELQYYRLTLTPSLLDKVHMNIKAGYDEFALFEIGKSHNKTHLEKTGKLPKELEMISLVYASKTKSKGEGSPFYKARALLDYLGSSFGQSLEYKPVDDKPDYPVTAPFNFARSAYVIDGKSGTFLGIVGEYKASVRKALKLPANSAGFEIGTEGIQSARTNQSAYQPLSRFPSTHQDISFKISSTTSYSDIANVVRQKLDQAEKEHGYKCVLVPTDIFSKDKTAKHISFRISLSHPDRTLVTSEVNKLLDSVASTATEKVKAVRL